MKEYEFGVIFYDAFGTFTVSAENNGDAHDKAINEIQTAIKDLSVQLEFDVNLLYGPEEDYEEDDMLDYGEDEAVGDYEFALNLYDAEGTFTILAETEEEAREQARKKIQKEILDLPVEVEFECELVEPALEYDEDEEDLEDV